MISADNEYEVNAIKFFMQSYGVNPGSYTVVLKRKPGMNQTDGLTIPAAADKFVIFISDKSFGAELIRLIAHEVAHVCQIIKGDMSFANVNGKVRVYWHGEEIDPDKLAYRKRPWEIEAYTLEKRYVHEFVKKFGNQLQERLVQQDGEWVLLAKSSDRVLKKFGKNKPSDDEVQKEEARIQKFKHMNESQIKAGDVVKIKKQFQDAGDDKYTWVAVDDEEKGRVVITPKDHSMKIKPTYTVMVNMLETKEPRMKTFTELMQESNRANVLIDETKEVRDAFKPYEKYGTVKVIPPDIDAAEDFFNVTVELKYPISSDTINTLNKSISSKVTFSDSASKNGACEIGSIRGNVMLEFFVDIPE